MIGQARATEGLYLLKDKDNYSDPLSLSLISVNSNKDEIWTHHHRLGHPSFKTLKRMFPSLFKNIDVEFFHCEVCEFAKHHRVSFPLSNTRSLSPFSLIHSDI